MAKSSVLELSKPDVSLQDPVLYKVIILNDDYTTVDFVVEILLTIFHKTYQEAVELTYDVHHKGSGVCGTYTYDIATTKIKEAKKEAKKDGFPLRLICEEA